MASTQSLKILQNPVGLFKSILKIVDRRLDSPAKKLWQNHDPRIDVALFQSNVPTLIINQNQCFLDWNIAFEMVFEELSIKKNQPISSWYEHLDNFRNIPKRLERLYGEGVLPITDRERVTFISQKYGRMVFTKIMSPILDRENGKIIGWTIVLNINSVNKRLNFFEDLYAKIEEREKILRFSASYDQIFNHVSDHSKLINFHLNHLKNSTRVLEIGSLGGEITLGLLSAQKKVTSISMQSEILRRIHEKCVRIAGRLKLIKRPFDRLDDIPFERYDGVSVALSSDAFANTDFLKKLISKLVPGTTLVLSTVTSDTDFDLIIQNIRQELDAKNRMSELKYFFNHVTGFIKDDFLAKKPRLESEEKIIEVFRTSDFKETMQSQKFFNDQVLGIAISV